METDIIIPTIYEFEQADKNLSTILNPQAKSVYKRQADKILGEIYGN